MGFANYIRRGYRYIKSGVPIEQHLIYKKNICLAPNELLNGRFALITGGSSGIGLAIADAFLSSGSDVIITGRNVQKLNSAHEFLAKRHPSAYIGSARMDNTHPEDYIAQLEGLTSHNCPPKKIDILVNNAGINGGKFQNTTEEEYNLIMDTNLKGMFFWSKAVAEYMRTHSIQGNILNILSSSSIRPANSAYAISKWGGRGFTLGLAKSLIPYGIVVNGLAPGPTATPMLSRDCNDNLHKPQNPSKRYTTPEEIANLAVVLVSEMGRMIVGDTLFCTGGAATITFDDIDYNF